MSKLKNLLSFITNLIFPHTCISCGAFTNHNYYTGLCVKCLNENKEFHIQQHPVLQNILKRSSFDSFNARFVYEEQIAKTILNFKFHDRPEYAKPLAMLMKPKALEIENYQDCIIVPVPVHMKRLLTRKYNQASLLAKYLALELNIDYSNKALKRCKHTPHQTGQSSKIRKQQLANAFIADESQVKGKNIILIDDVFTTGSTVKLCAEELKKKGANKIHVLTIAYTQI
jgi:ComF family protein